MTALVHRLARAVAISCRLVAIGADAIADATSPAPDRIPAWMTR